MLARIRVTSRLVLVLTLTLVAVACSDPAKKKQEHLEQGDKYVLEKKDAFAIVEYANAVKVDPKFGEARYKLAQVLERTNNPAAYAEYIRAADASPDNREAQIRATQILLLGRQFEDAKSRASALLEKDPKDLEAMLLRANAMAGLKDPEGAIAEVEQAMKVAPGDSRALVSLGAIRQGSGDRAQAEAAYRQAIALDPKSTDAQLALANFLWSAGRPDEAEQALKHALSIDPKHLLANRMLGVLYIATQRAAQAEQPLKAVAEISKAPAARLQLADYYIQVRRIDEAKQLLTELAKDQATANDAEVRLASLDYAGGQITDAHKRLDELIARAPQYVPGLVAKAQWMLTENKLDEALQYANRAVAANSESPDAQFILGAIHERRREPADAIKAFNEVLRLNPRAAVAQVALARLSLATGNQEAALKHAEEAKQADPMNRAGRVVLARSLLARGDLTRAETEINMLAAETHEVPVVYNLTGALQARKGNFDAARKSFSRVLELAPNDFEALAGLVGLDVQTKQVNAAVARVDAALAKSPNRPELLALASQVYSAAGQPARTEELLKRAVAADPGYSDGYALLAAHYFQQKRVDEARSEFESMVKRDPSAVAPRTIVGLILEMQGKRAEAKKWYEDTVATTNDAPIVANNLAMIYANEGNNLDQALQLAQSAKQRLPDSGVVDDTLGWIYYKKGLANLAVEPLESALKRLPDNAEVLYHLGLTYASLGDKAKARTALERAVKLNPKLAADQNAQQALNSVSR
jgi:putative PEP-CTERM system TPR-repeat lipoprotein